MFEGSGFRAPTANPRKLEHGLRLTSARIPDTSYLKGMRMIMFQLYGTKPKTPNPQPFMASAIGLRLRVLGFRVSGQDLIRIRGLLNSN